MMDGGKSLSLFRIRINESHTEIVTVQKTDSMMERDLETLYTALSSDDMNRQYLHKLYQIFQSWSLH